MFLFYVWEIIVLVKMPQGGFENFAPYLHTRSVYLSIKTEFMLGVIVEAHITESWVKKQTISVGV